MKIKEYLKTVYRRYRNTRISYSQTGEDLIADFFLSKIKQGFYVDIGTNDPIFLNNTYFFYKKNWKGICIEPNSFRCSLIKSTRPKDKVLNIGVGAKVGEMDFYLFNPDTISTFSLKEAEEFQKLGHELLSKSSVSVAPLKEVLSRELNGHEIDLISIDTEGLDLEVLKSNDWKLYRPKIIIVEVAEYRGTTLLRNEPEFSQFLFEQGYAKLADTYINGIYIDKKFAEQQGLTF